jgi:hypothetical protein
MRVSYRLRQGLQDLLAFRHPIDMDHVQQVLTPAQTALFTRMTHAEQLHSLNVLRTILKQAENTPHDLQVAALLHDVGKSLHPLNVAERSLAVVVYRLSPLVEARLSEAQRLSRWRAPFVVRRYHPRWGAEMLRTAGGSERAVWLVEHHADPLHQWQDHPHALLLARLQAADEAN